MWLYWDCDLNRGDYKWFCSIVSYFFPWKILNNENWILLTFEIINVHNSRFSRIVTLAKKFYARSYYSYIILDQDLPEVSPLKNLFIVPENSLVQPNRIKIEILEKRILWQILFREIFMDFRRTMEPKSKVMYCYKNSNN